MNASGSLRQKWSIFCIEVAVNVTKGQISDGTMLKNICCKKHYLCGKFQFYEKCTIFWLCNYTILSANVEQDQILIIIL